MLDSPPHSVGVQLRVAGRNERGSTVMTDVGELLIVGCLAEPVREWSSAEENLSMGQQLTDLLVIRSRTWPGDENSLIVYDGAEWETVGRPQHFRAGKRTRHFRVTAKYMRKVP